MKDKTEQGFTLIEVAIASVISMVSLIFLASLFTLSISQNRMNNHFNVTTALAQRKLEELNAIDYLDPRVNTPGGDLTVQRTVSLPSGTVVVYWDDVFVDDKTGVVQVGAQIPSGTLPNYRRYWRIENDPGLANTMIVSARVVASQAARSVGTPEETTLTTARSY
jgi:type II secretory pathway pseudopilin PulG